MCRSLLELGQISAGTLQESQVTLLSCEFFPHQMMPCDALLTFRVGNIDVFQMLNVSVNCVPHPSGYSNYMPWIPFEAKVQQQMNTETRLLSVAYRG